jgi:hypothetical protein
MGKGEDIQTKGNGPRNSKQWKKPAKMKKPKKPEPDRPTGG